MLGLCIVAGSLLLSGCKESSPNRNLADIEIRIEFDGKDHAVIRYDDHVGEGPSFVTLDPVDDTVDNTVDDPPLDLKSLLKQYEKSAPTNPELVVKTIATTIFGKAATARVVNSDDAIAQIDVTGATIPSTFVFDPAPTIAIVQKADGSKGGLDIWVGFCAPSDKAEWKRRAADSSRSPAGCAEWQSTNRAWSTPSTLSLGDRTTPTERLIWYSAAVGVVMLVALTATAKSATYRRSTIAFIGTITLSAIALIYSMLLWANGAKIGLLQPDYGDFGMDLDHRTRTVSTIAASIVLALGVGTLALGLAMTRRERWEDHEPPAVVAER